MQLRRRYIVAAPAADIFTAAGLREMAFHASRRAADIFAPDC